MSGVTFALVLVLLTLVRFWTEEREADMPQCDTCGPMYCGMHHPDCPEAP